MKYGTTITTELTVDEAIERITQALSEQGFGILTKIDVQATLKSKLNEDMEPYVILGACNPELAHQVLDIERDLGLLLPCNVVVRRDGDHTLIQALDPQTLVSLPDLPQLQTVADEAGRRLRAALDVVAGI
jgi:uncharacterized protein (DUF302 family)